jgi:hypothetical protein
MNWKLIIKDKKNQPTNGVYSDWKEQIAAECSHQCVYCSIHEAQFGGINNYHIDHFRPKSVFKNLENDICNLFYTCPICNRFKSDDWPSEPNLDEVSYPDPSKIDYSSLFSLNENFEINGTFTASKYLVARLFLNRAQLIIERREEISVKNATALINDLVDLIDKVSEDRIAEANEALKTLTKVQCSILKLFELKRSIRPYELKDIRKS